MVLKQFILWIMLAICSIFSQIDAEMHRLDFSQQQETSHQADVLKARFARSLCEAAEYGFINIYIKQSCYNRRQNKCTRIQFPYVRFDRQQAPSFDSLRRVSQLTPMFVDRKTQQTVFQLSDYVYVISSLINYNDESIALGDLIANGYASVLDDCSTVTNYIDIASFANSEYVDPELPNYNHRTNRFVDGIQTDYRTNFKEKCKPSRYTYGKQYQNKPDYYQPPYRKKSSKYCKPNYSRSPQGKCVDLLSDFYNCGSFGYVCSNTSKSCLGGICSETIPTKISNSIRITDWDDSETIDDSVAIITLPFALRLYNYSSNVVAVTTNSAICLGSDCPTTYTNTDLPSTSFSLPTVFCLWDDLDIYAYKPHGVYYNIVGTAPNRVVTFEFNVASHSSEELYYHFQTKFCENRPGIVECVYLDISDAGEFATVGAQYSPSGPITVPRYNISGTLKKNTVIILNTNKAT